MKISERRLALVLLAALITSANCKSQPAAGASNTEIGSPGPKAVAPVSYDELLEAIRTKDLRFEVRGLKNEASPSSISPGAVSFAHKATVIALGPDRYAKERYWLMFTTKRISGGDPTSARTAAYALVEMNDGVGDFGSSGGYRSASDKWEPEQIEIQLAGMIPWIRLAGEPIRGQ